MSNIKCHRCFDKVIKVENIYSVFFLRVLMELHSNFTHSIVRFLISSTFSSNQSSNISHRYKVSYHSLIEISYLWQKSLRDCAQIASWILAQILVPLLKIWDAISKYLFSLSERANLETIIPSSKDLVCRIVFGIVLYDKMIKPLPYDFCPMTFWKNLRLNSNHFLQVSNAKFSPTPCMRQSWLASGTMTQTSHNSCSSQTIGSDHPQYLYGTDVSNTCSKMVLAWVIQGLSVLMIVAGRESDQVTV